MVYQNPSKGIRNSKEVNRLQQICPLRIPQKGLETGRVINMRSKSWKMT